MAKVLVLVMDSFGIGASVDAVHYGDEGANTLGHIADYCAQSPADGGRGRTLHLPHLQQLGLGYAASASCGRILPGLEPVEPISGCYGYAVEQSVGKDTPSGHWEMMGLPVMESWHTFDNKPHAISDDILNPIAKRGKIPGFIGNCHASGTQIIADLGAESIATGKPIVYTSGDSVIQIAAHEDHFGLQRLYQLCLIAREYADTLNVARVIARPFIGEAPDFQRTPNRRDYSTPPMDDTLLDKLTAQQIPVIAIGKIRDIFAGRGIGQYYPGKNNMDLFDQTLAQHKQAPANSLVFTNFVDFDSHFGHRRDTDGYATALEQFDQRLPELFAQCAVDDLIIITADHGCDPSFPGSDHTREHVPVLVAGKSLTANSLGRRESFADIGQTIAEHFALEPLNHGCSFYQQLLARD